MLLIVAQIVRCYRNSTANFPLQQLSNRSVCFFFYRQPQLSQGKKALPIVTLLGTSPTFKGEASDRGAMHQDVARCRPPRPQTSDVVRVTQRQNAAWWIVSLHSLHQSGYSCQVSSQPLELVPTSFTRFAHETSDFFARKPYVRPVLSQVACTYAHGSKRRVLFQRKRRTNVAARALDAWRCQRLRTQEVQLMNQDFNMPHIFLYLDGFSTSTRR